MSRLRTVRGDDHPEAAGRHLVDADTLLTNDRPDGAAYLSGYVVECTLKSLWLLQTGVPVEDRGMPWHKNGHRLDWLNANVASLAMLADARIARYFKSGEAQLVTDLFADWKPEMRYAPACCDAVRVRTWLEAARQLYSSTVAEMWKDGVL